MPDPKESLKDLMRRTRMYKAMTVVGLAGTKGHGKNAVAEWLTEHKGYQQVAFADALKQFVRQLFKVPSKYLWGPSELRETPFDVTPEEWAYIHAAVGLEASEIRSMFTGHCDDPIPSLHMTLDKISGMDEITPRTLLQYIGTNWAKALWPDVWVERTMRDMETLATGDYTYDPKQGCVPTEGHKPILKFVVTDVRYPKDEGRTLHARNATLFWVDAARRIRDDRSSTAFNHSSEKTLADFQDADLPMRVIPNHGTLDDLHSVLRKLFP